MPSPMSVSSDAQAGSRSGGAVDTATITEVTTAGPTGAATGLTGADDDLRPVADDGLEDLPPAPGGGAPATAARPAAVVASALGDGDPSLQVSPAGSPVLATKVIWTAQ